MARIPGIGTSWIAPPGGSGRGTGEVLAGRLRRDRPEPGLLDATSRAGMTPGSTSPALPGDVLLAGAIDAFERYPIDDLGVGSAFGGAPAREYLGLPPTAPDAQSRGTGPRSDASASGQGVNDASADGGNTRFRVARPSGREVPGELEFDIFTALRGLFAYMKTVQAAADAGRPSPLPGFDFRRDVLGRADEPVSAAEDRLLKDLAYELSVPVATPLDTLTVVSRTSAAVRGQALSVPVNRPLFLGIWLRDPEQPQRSGEEETTVTLRLGLHPAIYEGLRVPLGQDGVILMPFPEVVPDPEPRWRVVTLVNARVDDFVTGFVYAALDDVGRLRLPVDENAVEIGGVSVESRFPIVKFRGEFLQMLLYAVIALLFAAGIVARVWRRA